MDPMSVSQTKLELRQLSLGYFELVAGEIVLYKILLNARQPGFKDRKGRKTTMRSAATIEPSWRPMTFITEYYKYYFTTSAFDLWDWLEDIGVDTRPLIKALIEYGWQDALAESQDIYFLMNPEKKKSDDSQDKV